MDDGNNANGQREINLNNFDGDVLGTQNNTLFSVSYHLTQGDANNNDNSITSPYYNTTPFSYQIFARIENNLKTDCFDTTLFTVNINPIPFAFDTTLVQCDEDGVNDGFTGEPLLNEEVIFGLNVLGLEVPLLFGNLFVCFSITTVFFP